MLTLTAKTIRNGPEDTAENIVKEMIEKQWPEKPTLAFPMKIMVGGKEVMHFDTREQYEQTNAALRLNAFNAIQQGAMLRQLKQQADEFAEIEYQTASTGEFN